LIKELATLINNCKEVEKEIQPTVKSESVKTNASIQDFENDLKRYMQKFKKSDIFEYTTGVEQSFVKIEEIEAEISAF
jgi:hypothetical protein